MFIHSSGRRRGVTLIELLVVMVIMLVIATIVVAFAPGFQDAQKVSRGSDLLQMWLVSARQTARSARVPTGLRLFIVNNYVSELQYIQQPPTYTVPYAVPPQPGTQQFQTALLTITSSVTASQAVLSMPTAGALPVGLQTGQIPGDFSGGGLAAGVPQTGWPVQTGDYLVVHGTICQVGAISAQNKNYPALADTITLKSLVTGNVASVPTSDYYFVRAARPLSGESTLKLPQDVVIDMTMSIPSVAASTNGTLDIIFSPSGEVISTSFSTGVSLGSNNSFQPNNKAVFWVMDLTKRSAGTSSTSSYVPNGNAQDMLIAVDCRTGMVAAQAVNIAGSDYYAFTKDGRSSGL